MGNGGRENSSDQVSQVDRATRLDARMQERRCSLTGCSRVDRSNAGGRITRRRMIKFKAQTRRSRSDWQQDSCPGPSAGAKWVFAAAGHERLSPDEAAEMTLDFLSMWTYRRLWSRTSDVSRKRQARRRRRPWLIWAEPRLDRQSERATVASGSKHAQGCFSLGVPDGSVQGRLAGPTRGGVSGLRHSLSGEIYLGARFVRRSRN